MATLLAFEKVQQSSTYNEFFGHLDNEHAQLRRKRKAWKKDFLPAIDAAREELCTYYSATEGR